MAQIFVQLHVTIMILKSYILMRKKEQKNVFSFVMKLNQGINCYFQVWMVNVLKIVANKNIMISMIRFVE